MLMVAILPLPALFHLILRWVVSFEAIYFSYFAYSKAKIGWMIAFAIMAFFYNPLVPIIVTGSSWLMVCVLAALVTLLSIRFVQ